MYFSVFSSSEYYSDEDINSELCVNKDELCLICWLPSKEINQITLLSDFSHINPKCKCKPKLHSACINHLPQEYPCCTICRTKMNIIIFTDDNNNFFVNGYITCISYCVYVFYKFTRVICYTSFVNLLVILFYNIYLIYIMTNEVYQDNYCKY